eukprot:TRINITY_DN21097_c0_g1_i1.p1 TRINITY_DN21097_c0_g1~~TRINITY_DN21097_c0_g1_i1.p1  ORF type:complete len:886 (-),score=151.25 TRINITY_DN21097_c0_g1_i1:177-2834(-)
MQLSAIASRPTIPLPCSHYVPRSFQGVVGSRTEGTNGLEPVIGLFCFVAGRRGLRRRAAAQVRFSQPVPWLQNWLPNVKEESREGPTGQDALLRFMGALEERGVELYEAQEEAVVELFSGAHVVLDTPTGSGKSLVAVAALFRSLAEGGRAYYTSPTKALTSEKFFDLCRHFGAASVGMATGDVSLNPRAQIVCCTAEVLASIALRDGPDSHISMVVMDEFHYFGDAERGVAWELPLWRLSRPDGCGPAFLLMSGTLGANPKLYKTLQERSGKPVRIVSSQDRPVPLHFHYSEMSLVRSLEELVCSGRSPVYVVHASQREALQTARELADAKATHDSGLLLEPALNMQGRREALQEAVASADFSSPFGPELQQLLLKGVGVHHAGLLPRYRRLVEQLAQASLLALVCGTDTLGVGVNVPIRSVVFTRLCKFDGVETRLLKSREFHQIAGRAGRKGFDTSGDVVAIEPDWVVHNRELQAHFQQSNMSKGEGRPLPRWRRPPRRNYKHWTKRTFNSLQRSSPDSLRSYFRLSMSQVLSLLEGARSRGRDGERELQNLIDAAQCSRSARRFWRRQAKAYGDSLRKSGILQDVESKLDSQDEEQEEKEAAVHPPGDDASLFVFESLPALQRRVGKEDLPLALLAAAEAVCDAPVSLLRAVAMAPADRDSGQRPAACPEILEGMLLEVFSDFRQKRPWLSQSMLQPKGLALQLVSRDLSFHQLAHLLGPESSAVTSEGGLLRYLADVYRTLRLGAVGTDVVHAVEAKLRKTLLDVDSSLVRQWEMLKELEQKTSSQQMPTVAEIAAEPGEEKLVGGAMVPAAATSKRRRSFQELEVRVEQVQSQLQQRWQQIEARELAWQRSIPGRFQHWSGLARNAVGDLWHATIGLVW